MTTVSIRYSRSGSGMSRVKLFSIWCCIRLSHLFVGGSGWVYTRPLYTFQEELYPPPLLAPLLMLLALLLIILTLIRRHTHRSSLQSIPSQCLVTVCFFPTSFVWGSCFSWTSPRLLLRPPRLLLSSSSFSRHTLIDPVFNVMSMSAASLVHLKSLLCLAFTQPLQ